MANETSTPSVWAIIPARGGSKGIKRKNLQLLGDHPLVGHTILQAQTSPAITHVLVNSEDDEICQVAERYDACVMGRPEEFHHDNSVQEVDRLLIWTVQQLEQAGESVEVVVLLYSTSPLRTVEHITQTVQRVTEQGCDSALTLYEDSTYLWQVKDGQASPTNYDPKLRGPRQKENWNQWAENKAVYAMTRDLLLNTGCRLGGKIGYVEMPKWRSVDVDSPDDLELVRRLWELRVAGQTGA